MLAGKPRVSSGNAGFCIRDANTVAAAKQVFGKRRPVDAESNSHVFVVETRRFGAYRWPSTMRKNPG
jgi:hypothetical protein